MHIICRSPYIQISKSLLLYREIRLLEFLASLHKA